MSRPHSRPHSRRISLEAGQSLRLQAADKTELVCLRGGVFLDCAPLWLGERMQPQHFPLAEGESRLLQSGGGIAIHARQDAEILLLRPQSKLAALLHLLKAATTAIHRAAMPAAGKGL